MSDSTKLLIAALLFSAMTIAFMCFELGRASHAVDAVAPCVGRE